MYIGEEPETEFMGAFGPKKHKLVPGKAFGHHKGHGKPQEVLIRPRRGMEPQMQFMGEKPEADFLGESKALERDAKKGYCGKNPTSQFMGDDEPEVQFLSASQEYEEQEAMSDDGLPCPNAEGYCGPPPTEQFMGAYKPRRHKASPGRGLKRGHHKGEAGGPPGLRGSEPHETAEIPDEPEEQFMGSEPAPELHFPPFMGNSPESEFLGGDLLVIEGLDQAVGPYEPDYRPDLVPWVTKPSTNHFAAYRQGPKYWGPGAQYEPGFQKEQRLPSTDDWHTNAMEGLGDLGLHSEAEQQRALQVAENHFRKAIDALRRGNKAIYHENLGFLRGVRRLAELEGAADLMRRVEKMIRELR